MERERKGDSQKLVGHHSLYYLTHWELILVYNLSKGSNSIFFQVINA